ncbi:HET-domain-containing protein, partial [Coniophora puteana RWD-64-598 SS2]
MQESALKLGHSQLQHGRIIRDMVNLDLIRKWLRICEHTHGEACESDWWRGNGEGNSLPSTVRMIDVQEMMIVSVAPGCRYIALSYLWGGVGESYWTSTENLPTRSRPQGLPISILPGTITDSILLTRLLGERYLWVDALCIVQDDPADKVIQIGVMERIYGFALLTIFAAGGTTAHAPLPGLRANTREVHQRIENVQNLLFSAALPGPDEAIARTAWNTRGWT